MLMALGAKLFLYDLGLYCGNLNIPKDHVGSSSDQ